MENKSTNDYYPIDLEHIKTKEFAAIVYDFMHKNNLYSSRYIVLKDLYRKLMGVPHSVAGRGEWLVFKYLFSNSRRYLSTVKGELKVYIEPRKATTLTSMPNSSKRVSVVGYSLANKPSDFHKANEILMELRDIIEEGIKNNIKLSEEMRTQQKLEIKSLNETKNLSTL